jgi:hypothetical protein
MALRRRYRLTGDGLLDVFDERTGKLTEHYQPPSSPTFGFVDGELCVAEDGSHTLVPNGVGEAAVRTCIELLLLLQEDLGIRAPDPRAF